MPRKNSPKADSLKNPHMPRVKEAPEPEGATECLPDETKAEIEEEIEEKIVADIHELKQIIRLEMEETYAGPVPHPSILARYEKISPGFADRLIAMAENEGQHRRTIEKTLVEGEIGIESRNSTLGVVFGFIICMTAIVAAGICIYSGQQVGGSILGVGGLGGIMSTFIWGTRHTRKTAQPKSKPVEQSGAR